jgi:hypothetical protein
VISLKTKHVAVVVPLVFAAGIGLTIAFNLWQTETTKVPVAFSSGEFAGQANPADIRGSYTFADIAKAFPVPVEDLGRAFGVTGGAAAFQVKSLEAAFGDLPGGRQVGTDSVRLFVARYVGLPFDPAETTALPAAAVEILAARPGLSSEQLADLRARAVALPAAEAAATPAPAPAAAAPAAPAPAAPAPTASAPAEPAAAEAAAHSTTVADRTVKGSTTFQNLADWGVSDEDLRKVLGGDPGAPATALKDYCASKGFEFSTVKAALQDLVNARP